MNEIPFENAEEAWFWFVHSMEAKNNGLGYQDESDLKRPCEVNDIYNIIMRLYLNRTLRIEHFRVLKHYGLRQIAPDPMRIKELSAHSLWIQAMDRLEPILIRRGIVVLKPDRSH